MPYQDDPSTIRWRIHLSSPPESVYQLITTDEGRARFWAESTEERDGNLSFHFPNGWEWSGEILGRGEPSHFSINYFDSTTTFTLASDGSGGTELTLTDDGVPEVDRCEVAAGWISVLMALKAAVDYGVDLRNHDPQRTWDQGYCNN